MFAGCRLGFQHGGRTEGHGGPQESVIAPRPWCNRRLLWPTVALRSSSVVSMLLASSRHSCRSAAVVIGGLVDRAARGIAGRKILAGRAEPSGWSYRWTRMDRSVGGVPGRARLLGMPEAARCLGMTDQANRRLPRWLPRSPSRRSGWLQSKQDSTQMNSKVEERRGAAIAVRLPSPLIKPDVRISRIRLSDWLRGRLTSWRWGLGTCAVAARPEGRILLPC